MMFEMKGDYLSWFGVMLSIFLIYYTFRYQYSKGPLAKQLYKVYLPMFRSIENIIYKRVEDIGVNEVKKITEEFDEIIDKNYELVKPSIIFWNKTLSECLNVSEYNYKVINESFIELCYQIDLAFEKTRRRMFLPTRNRIYRMNNRQFPSKKRLYMSVFIIIFPQFFMFLAMILLFYFLGNLLF